MAFGAGTSSNPPTVIKLPLESMSPSSLSPAFAVINVPLTVTFERWFENGDTRAAAESDAESHVGEEARRRWVERIGEIDGRVVATRCAESIKDADCRDRQRRERIDNDQRFAVLVAAGFGDLEVIDATGPPLINRCDDGRSRRLDSTRGCRQRQCWHRRAVGDGGPVQIAAHGRIDARYRSPYTGMRQRPWLQGALRPRLCPTAMSSRIRRLRPP